MGHSASRYQNTRHTVFLAHRLLIKALARLHQDLHWAVSETTLTRIFPTPTHEEAAFYANALGLESLTARKLTGRQPYQAHQNATTGTI